jgi:uncharacterized membrane protein
MNTKSILFYALLGLAGIICFPLLILALLLAPLFLICCIPLIVIAFLARWVLIGAIREYKKTNSDS